MKSNPYLIELLESRIAPATLVDAHTVTYLDLDFDIVTVKISKGTFADPNVSTDDFTFTGGVFGSEQLVLLDLSNDAGAFDGAKLTFSVKRGFGDGFVNVGYINSTGNDLGKVTVKGDLGRIDAGDATATKPGLKSLNVQSLGRLGTDTQTGIANLQSHIQHGLGALVVKGDVVNANVNVLGGVDGKIGSVTLGGSLIGGETNGTGQIASDGGMGPVKIGHDVQGGLADISGGIHSDGRIASVTIGGSLIGGLGFFSGGIDSNTGMGPVKIGHNVRGNAGDDSGKIFSFGKLGPVTIGGSLIGGAGNYAPVAGTEGQIHSGGAMGPVKIAHDVQGGAGSWSGSISTNSTLASVTIGGSLVGGTNLDSGEIRGANIGAVKIGHDVKGGSSTTAGSIFAGSKLASVTIGGSLIGGSVAFSGQIASSNDMGLITIGHDLLGGSGINSGRIISNGKLAGVTLGGSLIGGSNFESGEILSDGDLGVVKIRHDLIGGSISGAATFNQSGYIQSSGRIASVIIGGSIVSGIDDSSGALSGSASIRAGNDIGSLTVKGGLIGNSVGDLSPVIISARGQAVQGATIDLAIGKLTIGGRVELSYILAGYDTALTAKNADAQIGAVQVRGDWAASSLVAGAMNSASLNTKFGDANDAKISGAGTTDTAGIISKIASITIGGRVFGTPTSANNSDHFGFVAGQIVSFKASGATIPLTLDAHNDNRLIGGTGDVTLHEI